MNKYRNVKTGAVIRTTGVVGGKNWVSVEEPQQTHVEETSEAETVQEGAPAEKTKATRRGKK